MKTKLSKIVASITIYLLILAIIIMQWPSNLNELLNLNYGILTVAYIIVAGLFVIAIIEFNVYIFEPLTIISVLYLCIMVIYPIYDIHRGNITTWGIDTSQGCFKGTIIFLLSYISFFLAYYCKIKRIKVMNNISKVVINKLDRTDSKHFVKISTILWIISFILCIISRVSSGYSLKYIFTLGSEGVYTSNSESIALLFLSNFNTTMITSWMYIIIFSKNRYWKIISTILTLIYVIMSNGRWLMFLMVGSPIVYYYVSKRKSPYMIKIISIGIITLGIFAVMQAMRTSIHYGTSPIEAIITNGFTIEDFFAPFESDFDTYKNYYGVVMNIPKNMGFLYGKGIFIYTIVMFIPRAIWPSKPSSPVHDVITVSVSELAMKSGEAFPNIAEYYYEFGIIGCIIFSFVLGRFATKSKMLYKSESKHCNIIYSMLYPFLFQLVARNFTAQFYHMIFAIIPHIVFYLYVMNNKTNNIYKFKES